jgi:hypothetical protein
MSDLSLNTGCRCVLQVQVDGKPQLVWSEL